MSLTGNEVTIHINADDATGDTLNRSNRRFEDWFGRLRNMFSGFGTWTSQTWSRMLGKAGEDAGEKLADGLWRSTDGRLRDQKGRFARAGEQAASSFFDGFSGMLSDGFQEMSKIVSGVGIGTILKALAILTAAILALPFLAPAIGVLGGAFASVGTIAAGLAATVGVLMLGFGGIGDAWQAYSQKASGGGKSGAAAAREVKSATDALADAQRNALRAQQDLVRAREDEAERLEDLSRSLAAAHLDEEGAVLAVARARERMVQARRTGTGLDQAEANLGYRQALLSLEQIRDRVEDLSKEKAEADKKGVEGSDQVQSALERQVQAERHLADATVRLADVQSGASGGVDKFAAAMAKLSVNGQALVTALTALKPRFDELKKSVQDRLLAGMDVKVKDLATVWLPALDSMLGGIAGSLNKVMKGFAAAFSKPQFIKDMQASVAGFGGFLEKLGSGSEAFFGGMMQLGRAAVPFLSVLGDLIEGMFKNFEEWIKAGDESGGLAKFIDKATKGLKDLWTIGGLVVKIFADFIGILMGDSASNDDFLAKTIKFLEDIRTWLADPQNRKDVKEWIDGLIEFAITIGRIVKGLTQGFNDMMANIHENHKKIQDFTDKISALGDTIKKAFSGAGTFDALKDSFRGAMNWIIDRWNGLEFKIPGMKIFGSEVGGGRIGTYKLDHFAQGGIGGGLAMVAEHGRELINTPGGMLLAMPHGSTVIPNGTTESMLSGGGGQTVRVQIDLQGGDDDFRRKLQKLVKVFGDGNVQVAFGTGSG